MRKNVLLMDVDSAIPNLALLKLSAWHKMQGDNTVLQRGLMVSSRINRFDKVYISCVFAKNGNAARRLATQFPDAEVHLGGTGVDLVTELPYEIEHIMPDYDLYPDCDTSYGFTSRGCIRKCPFCVVPIKEKGIRVNADIYEFWDHFEVIATQLIKENLLVDFNQGLDVRLIDNKNSEILSKLKMFPEPRGFSPSSILPPGNSHLPSKASPLCLLAINILPFFRIMAAVTFVGSFIDNQTPGNT